MIGARNGTVKNGKDRSDGRTVTFKCLCRKSNLALERFKNGVALMCACAGVRRRRYNQTVLSYSYSFLLREKKRIKGTERCKEQI